MWVWVVTGYAPNFTLAGQMWPGNGYVDWISWEAYNNAGCTAGAIDPTASRTFSASMTPFLTWLQQNGPAAGIDLTKPMMISEAGSVIFSGQPELDRAVVRQDSQCVAPLSADSRDHLVGPARSVGLPVPVRRRPAGVGRRLRRPG